MRRVTMKPVIAGAVLLVGGSFASACGGFTMTDEAATQLAAQVQQVRSAAGSGNRSVAEAALAQLRATVDQLRSSEALAEDRASVILAAAADVEQALDVMPTTTTTTLSPFDDDYDDDEGRGKGHGKKGKD